jgi:hypothetical protein
MECACIALVLFTSVSPGAMASGQGKSGDHGKALEAQSGSLPKKLARLSVGNPAVLTVINAYKAAMALAAQNFNTAIAAVNLALKPALTVLIPAPSPSPTST